MTKDTLSKISSGREWSKFLLSGILSALFLLLPWQTRYIFFTPTQPYEYGTLSLLGIEILAWLAIALGAWRIKKIIIDKSKMKILILPALLALVGVFSIAWSLNYDIGLQGAVRLMSGILLFCVLAYSSENKFIYLLVVAGIIQSFLGICQFLFQTSFASAWLGMALHDPGIPGTAVIEIASGRWLRAYGSLPHPNALGGFLAVAMVFAFTRVKLNSLKWGSMFILLTGLFFTFSRSAWIACLVFFVWALIRKRQKGELIYWLLILTHILLLISLFKPLVFARSTLVERLEKQSYAERVAGLQESWSLIKKNPIVGVGISNYTQAVRSSLRLNDPLYSYQPAHNAFLLIVAELGMIGFLIFVWSWYRIARYSKFYILHVVLFILLFFDHYFWSIPFGILLFWGVLGLGTFDRE